MKIKIINTGKVRDKFIKQAMKEYAKRLSTYCKIQYIENKNPVKEITDKSYIIRISKDGEQLSSEQLAEKISLLGVTGNSDIVIIVGDIDVDSINVDFILSISKMDIDGGLILIILHEQIYRSYRINLNHPYHK